MMAREHDLVRKQYKTRYMPGLDGLRAIAVVAVIIYHLNPQILSGGFLGVDTFFVISGFLITSLLLHEYSETGRIDLKNFWIRRFKRLIPAVVFLLMVLVSYMALFHLERLMAIKSDVFAALVYMSNWWFIIKDVSYFEALEAHPLKHLWSLAIEEQFYIIWPLVLLAMLVFVKRMNRIWLITFILSLVSLIVMIVLSAPFSDNSRVYFGTDTRAHSLLIGVMLAYIFPPFRLKAQIDRASSVVLNSAGIISLGILIYMFTFVSASHYWIYAGGLYLIAALTTVLIAASVHPTTFFATKLLGNPLFVWIGKRSYSLYLWHYPIIVLSNTYFIQGQVPIYMIIIQIVLTLVMAEISYRFIEQPFRREGFKALGFKRVVGRVRFVLVAGLGVVLALFISGVLDGPIDDVLETRNQEQLSENMRFTSSIKTIDQSIVNQQSIRSLEPLFIGDSITVDIEEEVLARMPNATVDGNIGRQLWDVQSLVEENYTDFVDGDDIVVLQLGTNGTIAENDMEALVDLFGDATVYLINTRSPRDWQNDVNALLMSVSENNENVHLIDWHGTSAGHPEYFSTDGVHLTPLGKQVIVQEIVDVIDEYSLVD